MSRTERVRRLSGAAAPPTITHERYIHGIREIALSRLNDEESRRKLLGAKLTYGSGQLGLRGRCFYDAWENGQRHEFIEVCASGEESDVQLAGTTLHELAHCAVGFDAGHGPVWKQAAQTLGLVRALAAGQEYGATDFAPALWEQVRLLPLPSDGRPAFDLQKPFGAAPRIMKPRPCPLGIGTRGGVSRGSGSGSRLRLFVCACEKPVKVRIARDTFNARCLDCGSEFKRTESTRSAH